MAIAKAGTRTALWIKLPWLVLVLLVSGCTGWQPYEPRDDRREGPEKGFFSGEAGEFVIFRRSEEKED